MDTETDEENEEINEIETLNLDPDDYTYEDAIQLFEIEETDDIESINVKYGTLRNIYKYNEDYLNLIDGLKANIEKCEGYIEDSLAMCTSLAPIIGYDKAAFIAKEAFQKNKSIREICLEKNILPKTELNKILNPFNMIQSNAKSKK